MQTDSSNFQTYFEYLYSDHGQHCWTAIVDHLPECPWFLVCHDWGEELGIEDKNIRLVTWASYLVSKDLVVGFCPIEEFHKNPSFTANSTPPTFVQGSLVYCKEYLSSMPNPETFYSPVALLCHFRMKW